LSFRDGVELVVGHVGDTRVILCRDGQPIRLSEDHHPERRDEAERVKKCGGFIKTNSLGVMQVNYLIWINTRYNVLRCDLLTIS